MEAYTKVFGILGLLVFVSISEIHRVEGAGECGVASGVEKSFLLGPKVSSFPSSSSQSHLLSLNR